jgi:hypothetical protein
MKEDALLICVHLRHLRIMFFVVRLCILFLPSRNRAGYPPPDRLGDAAQFPRQPGHFVPHPCPLFPPVCLSLVGALGLLIFGRLSVRDRTQATVFATQHGLCLENGTAAAARA